MSKLAGRQAKTTIFDLGGIDITLYPIPFGKVISIQQEYRKIDPNDDLAQLRFITRILLEHTDLTESDLGENDYSITTEEAGRLFFTLVESNQDPKAIGQEVNLTTSKQ